MLKAMVFSFFILGSQVSFASGKACGEAVSFPAKLSEALEPYLKQGFYLMEYKKMDYTGSYQVTLYHPLPQGRYAERSHYGRGMTLQKIIRL